MKPEDSYYDDAEFAIVKGNTVLGNLMDDVRFYGELALVREEIEKIHEALPDYKYVPMRDVREAMYPEKIYRKKSSCKTLQDFLRTGLPFVLKMKVLIVDADPQSDVSA